MKLFIAAALLFCSSFSFAQIQNDQTTFGKSLSSQMVDHGSDSVKCKKCR